MKLDNYRQTAYDGRRVVFSYSATNMTQGFII